MKPAPPQLGKISYSTSDRKGIEYDKAMAAMISGFCKDVFNELPDEFGAEVNQLMSLKFEGSVR